MSEPLSSEERELLGDWWDSDWPDTQAGAMGTLYATVERIVAARLAALTAEVERLQSDRDEQEVETMRVAASADEWWGLYDQELRRAERLQAELDDARRGTPAPDAGERDTLAKVRADLRREIGPPTDRDPYWQPMVAASEVRVLLDALDDMDARLAAARHDAAEAALRPVEVPRPVCSCCDAWLGEDGNCPTGDECCTKAPQEKP